MSGSTFGRHFKITTFGESHGEAVGVVIDGVPAGLLLCEDDISDYLVRRRPGQNIYTTARAENDTPAIISGVFQGITTGSPLTVIIKNETQNSKDYSDIAQTYRPGHADYTYDKKYGIRDYRGGGRSSGRETIGRVAAGAVASKILAHLGIEVMAFTKSIGPYTINNCDITKDKILASPLYMPDLEMTASCEQYLQKIKEMQDSCGGVVECIAKNVPAGIGDPVFDKLDALLSQAVMSIGAVKAVEIGDGIRVSDKKGSENNDEFYMNEGKVCKRTNHSGGILGGISDGSDIIVRAHFKPTPSIAQEQHTIKKDHTETTISIHGRHDPIIVPRAVVVVESMTCITILDALMSNTTSRISYLEKIYLDK